jgi:hypothetical protein
MWTSRKSFRKTSIVVKEIRVIRVRAFYRSSRSFGDCAKLFQSGLPLTTRQPLKPFPQCFGHHTGHGLSGLVGYGRRETMGLRVFNIEGWHAAILTGQVSVRTRLCKSSPAGDLNSRPVQIGCREARRLIHRLRGSGRVPHVRLSVHGPKTMFSNAFSPLQNCSLGPRTLRRTRWNVGHPSTPLTHVVRIDGSWRDSRFYVTWIAISGSRSCLSR